VETLACTSGKEAVPSNCDFIPKFNYSFVAQPWRFVAQPWRQQTGNFPAPYSYNGEEAL
jgi:hypothetical protein